MAVRQTGFALLCSNSVQEAQDIAAIAQQGLILFHAEPALNGNEAPQGDLRSLAQLQAIFRNVEKGGAGKARQDRMGEIAARGRPVNKVAWSVAKGDDRLP